MMSVNVSYLPFGKKLVAESQSVLTNEENDMQKKRRKVCLCCSL